MDPLRDRLIRHTTSQSVHRMATVLRCSFLLRGVGAAYVLHLDLLVAHLIPHGLHAIHSFSLNHHFFRDVDRLRDHWLLSRLGDFDSFVRPVEISYVVRIGNRPSKYTRVLFMQG